MKKGVLFVLVFLIFLQVVSASISIQNFSIKSKYYANENISGLINLSVTNEYADLILRTTSNKSINFVDFLRLNGASYSCSNFNCSKIFLTTTSGDSLVFKVNDSYTPIFGFNLTGQSVTIQGITFVVNSDFKESDSSPLNMKFFDSSDSPWTFDKFSDNFMRSTSLGCFSSNSTTTANYISEISNSSDNPKMYCEKISLPDTPKIKAYARLQGTGTSTFIMTLFNSNKLEISKCSFSKPTDDSCIISPTSAISKGDYYLCIRSPDANGNYKIASEQLSPNCGWWGNVTDSINTGNSSFDYGLFAKTPLFAAAMPTTISSTTRTNLVNNANNYILKMYNRNCSSGCVLPIYASGVDQNMTISNVIISYSPGYGDSSSKSVSGITPKISNVSFSGALNLSYTGFNVGAKGNKTLQLILGNTTLFSKLIEVQSSLNIFYVYPDNPPSGIEIEFTAEVASETNSTKFQWQWGDGTTTNTTTNKAKHKYDAINTFNLTLTLTDANNFTITKSFTIAAGSPKGLVNASLTARRDAINYAIQTKNSFPSWFNQKLDQLTNLSMLQTELSQLDSQRAIAITDLDYLTLFNKIQNLTVPYSFSIGESSTSPLLTDMNDINPSPIAEFTGGSEENLDNYKQPISQWQRENIASQIKRQQIIVIYTDNTKVPILNIVSATVTSNSDDESYFVIQKPFEDVYFKEESGARKSGDSTIIVLNPGETKTFEFYTLGNTAPIMYASPKLSLLPVVSQLEPCNFNNVCEKDLNEDYKNCRNDCFPVVPTIIWMIVLLIFAIILYTGLAYWYKTRYETSLFKDRRLLYNLLMFIANARAAGLSDLQISANLKKNNWTSEQITYAIKKSKGERTGLPELIPFDKIFAALREKTAKQNLNKSPNQGINRW